MSAGYPQERRIADLEAEVRRLRDREATIIKALAPVSDGGQYRADIVSAIDRLAKDRDALRASEEKALALIAQTVKERDKYRDGLRDLLAAWERERGGPFAAGSLADELGNLLPDSQR